MSSLGRSSRALAAYRQCASLSPVNAPRRCTSSSSYDTQKSHETFRIRICGYSQEVDQSCRHKFMILCFHNLVRIMVESTDEGMGTQPGVYYFPTEGLFGHEKLPHDIGNKDNVNLDGSIPNPTQLLTNPLATHEQRRHASTSTLYSPSSTIAHRRTWFAAFEAASSSLRSLVNSSSCASTSNCRLLPHDRFPPSQRRTARMKKSAPDYLKHRRLRGLPTRFRPYVTTMKGCLLPAKFVYQRFMAMEDGTHSKDTTPFSILYT